MLDERLSKEARERLEDPNLPPLLKEILCGHTIKDKDIERL
jgi:hypothetical protein